MCVPRNVQRCTDPIHRKQGRWSAVKLSARNQLKGTVVEVREGAVEALVKMDVGGQIITAVITVDAVKDMGLVVGDEAVAIIKADHVILGK